MSSPNHEDSSNSMAIFCDHEDNGIHMLSNLAEYFATCFDVTLVIHCTDMFDMHFNNAINVISVTSMSDFFFMFWPNELSDIIHHSEPKYIFSAFMEDDKRIYVKKVCDAFVSFSKEGYEIYDNTHDLKYYAKVSPNEVAAGSTVYGIVSYGNTQSPKLTAAMFLLLSDQNISSMNFLT